ncbi:MAG: hypothetical protein SNJ29_16320 [Rikenellaceae bacterium]
MQHRALRLLTSFVSIAYINPLRNECHDNRRPKREQRQIYLTMPSKKEEGEANDDD